MRVISPTELEIQYSRLERKLYFELAKSASPFHFVAAAIGVCSLIAYFNDMVVSDRFSAFLFGSVWIIRLFMRAIFAAIGLSVVGLVVPARRQTLFLAFSSLVVWSLGTGRLAYEIHDSIASAILSLSLPMICIGGWMLLSSVLRDGRSRKRMVWFSIFFWSFTSATSWLLYGSNERALKFFWQLRPQFIWLSFLIFAAKQGLRRDDLKVAAHPINLLRAVIWPEESAWLGGDQLERRRAWWNGISNIALGFALLLVVSGLERFLGSAESASFKRSALQYFNHVLLGDIAVLNIIAGFIRIFGFRVMDATNFVLLSRSPAEFWRRASVYNYQFVLRYVYLPLRRIFKVRGLLATFLSFTVFYFNHYGFWNLVSLFLVLIGLQSPLLHAEAHAMIGSSVHFLMLFLLMYVSRRYWFTYARPGQRDTVGWFSILLTHFLMICAYHVFFLIIAWSKG